MALVERFVLGVDMKDFSTRPARIQDWLSTELDRILDETSARVGLDRSRWVRQPGGDGELAVLTADVDLVAMVGDFVRHLDRLLTDHNEIAAPNAAMRLRVAMHTGALKESRFGFVGDALITLARLLDCAGVRDALDAAPDANLAQIISGSLFDKAVAAELDGLRPRQFRQVEVRVKSFREIAYVHVPGAAVPLPPAPPPRLFKFPEWDFPAPKPPVEEKPAERPVRQAVAVLGDDVLKLLDDLRAALGRGAWEQADVLTTTALLTEAGRVEAGWLRFDDGGRLTDRLFAGLDAAWSEHSGGAWGFRAQRDSAPDARTPGYFRALLTAFGWSADGDGTVPPYPEFSLRADRSLPFYPTLRNPARERFPEWHDEWERTVVAVHSRLRTWT
ncbi:MULTISPECIES: GUN4 domain-containing protein [unclassified Saccharothrix]|uniref:GUN4 domain-containing protein n=1 Tax=unclassified Saccharothrix TaxID=2593673 RepID=UPI00307CE0CB